MGSLRAGKGSALHPVFFLVPRAYLGTCQGGQGCDQKPGDGGPLPALHPMSSLTSGTSLAR